MMADVQVYDRNARVPGRKPNYWLRYRVAGKQVREPAKDTKKRSLEYAAYTSRLLDTGSWVHPSDRKRGVHLFEFYAKEVIDRRSRRGVKTASTDEAGHVENHLAPMFAGLRF